MSRRPFHRVITAITMAALAGCSSNSPPVSSPEQLAVSVVEALKYRDSTAFLILGSTTADQVALYRTADLSAEERAERIRAVEENQQDEWLSNQRIDNFGDILRRHDWSRLTVASIVRGESVSYQGVKLLRNVLVSFVEDTAVLLEIDLIASVNGRWTILDDAPLSLR